jgi:drug/metabolite transporter (DMT)-like permease
LISYLGFTMVPLGHGVVILPAASALAGLIPAALALREPTTKRRMLGVGAIVVGLSLFGAEATTTIGRHGLLGDFLFLVAGIAWGVFGIQLRHWGIDGTRAAIVICVLALVLYAPAHGLISGVHIPGASARLRYRDRLFGARRGADRVSACGPRGRGPRLPLGAQTVITSDSRHECMGTNVDALR